MPAKLKASGSFAQTTTPQAEIQVNPIAFQTHQSDKNLNIMLFVASLLLVAAGAAFVAAAMPDTVKFVGVWLLVVGFYGAGMLLHYTSKRLKPAATAFLGTGLALVPFAGLALGQYTDVMPAVAWLITSIIGLIAYFWAALRLQSQVVSYLTMALVVSLASSFSEVLSLPLVWNFVVIIGVALLASTLAIVKPAWVPKIFKEAIERTGQFVTPLALVASLVLYGRLGLWDYKIIFAVATLHYALAWFQQPRALAYETLTRVLLHSTLLMVTWDLSRVDSVIFGTIFLGLATLQQLYSIIRHAHTPVSRAATEWSWMALMYIAQIASLLFWFGNGHQAILTVFTLVVIGSTSAAVTLSKRAIMAALPGLLVSVVLPFVVFQGVLHPAASLWVSALTLGILASIVLCIIPFLRHFSEAVRQFFIIACMVYIVVAFVTSFAAAPGMTGLLMTGLAILVWVASYVCKIAPLSIFGNMLLALSVGALWLHFDLHSQWLLLGVSWIAGGLLYILHWVLHLLDDKSRSTGLIGVTWTLVVIAFLGVSFQQVTAVAASWTLVGGALTLAIYGYQQKRQALMEAAVYIATFGLQRVIGLTADNLHLNVVFYAHWWALTIAGVAWWRTTHRLVRLMVALSFVTASTGLLALSEGGVYQLVFLIEHLALLVAGFLLKKRWAIWWGAIASSLAVLYFLKDFLFLWLGFLGLIMIGIVIWRLIKVKSE